MKKYIIPALAVLLVIVSGLAVYFYMKGNVSTLSENTQSDDIQMLAKVKKLIMLPEGETPTIATVSDLEKLKGQAFFIKAKIGDKVIIFSKARKAYLYDPTANKILEVAPIESPDAVTVVSGATTTPAKMPVSTPARKQQ